MCSPRVSESDDYRRTDKRPRLATVAYPETKHHNDPSVRLQEETLDYKTPTNMDYALDTIRVLRCTGSVIRAQRALEVEIVKSIENGEIEKLQKLTNKLPIPACRGADWILCGDVLAVAIKFQNVEAVRVLINAASRPGEETIFSTMPRNKYPNLKAAAELGNRVIFSLLWNHLKPALSATEFPETNAALRISLQAQACWEVAAVHGRALLLSDYLDWSEQDPPFPGGYEAKLCALYAAVQRCKSGVMDMLLQRATFHATDLYRILDDITSLEEDREPRAIRDDGASTQYHMVSRLIEAIEASRPPVLIPDELVERSLRGPDFGGALRALLEKGVGNPDLIVENPCILLDAFSNAAETTHLHYQHGGFGMDCVKAGRFVTSGNCGSETLLECAAEMAPTDVFKRLHTRLQQRRHCKTTNAHGETLLHYAAAGGKHQTIQHLIGEGFDVNATSKTGWTPLLCAIARNSPCLSNTPRPGKTADEACQSARVLLDHGAKPDKSTLRGWTVLHLLATYSDVGPEFHKLVNQLFDPERSYELPPVECLAIDIEYCLSGRDGTAYHAHAWGHRLERMLSDLERKGIAIDPGLQRLTALHVARWNGADAMEDLLVDHSPDTEAIDSRGRVPADGLDKGSVSENSG